MKLPEVRYSRVQSLGRQDANQPLRTSQANFRAVQAQDKVMRQVNDQVDRLYQMDAESEYQDLAIQYEERIQEETQALTESRYEETEDGEVRSRHDKLYEEWQEAEKRVREEVKGKSTNNLATKNLETLMDDRKVELGGKVAATAAEWTRDVSRRRYVKSIEKKVQGGDHDSARDIFVEAATSGALTEEQMAKIPTFIMADEQYKVAQEEIESVNQIENLMTTREQILDPQMYPDMSDTQRQNLVKQLDQRVDDTISSGLRAVIETQGLERGAQYVHSVNEREPGELGLSGEDAQYSIVSRLQSIYNDYKFQMEEEEAATEVEIRASEINQGAWADPETEGKYMDAAFEQWVQKNEIEKLSPEWQGRVAWHAETQGWVPPSVMVEVRGMLNYGNPDAAIAAATLVSNLENDPNTTRAVQSHMSDSDIRLAQMINDYAAYGQDPTETVKNVRQGLHQVPDAHRKARENEFDQNLANTTEDTLKDKIDEDPHSSSWYEVMKSDPEAGIEVREEYRRIFRDEYVRTGEQGVASKRAYNLLRRKYAVVERGGDLRLEAMSPESIKGNGGPTPWITEEFNAAAKELGRDPENLELVHFRQNGQHQWVFYDREESDVVPSPTNPGQWATITFDYKNSESARRARKEFEEERKAAQIQRDRARAEDRERQRLKERFESVSPRGFQTPGQEPNEAEVKSKFADDLQGLGTQFWEMLLDSRNGDRVTDPRGAAAEGAQ